MELLNQRIFFNNFNFFKKALYLLFRLLKKMKTSFNAYESVYEYTEGNYPFGRELMYPCEQTCQHFLK